MCLKVTNENAPDLRTCFGFVSKNGPSPNLGAFFPSNHYSPFLFEKSPKPGCLLPFKPIFSAPSRTPTLNTRPIRALESLRLVTGNFLASLRRRRAQGCGFPFGFPFTHRRGPLFQKRILEEQKSKSRPSQKHTQMLAGTRYPNSPSLRGSLSEPPKWSSG